VAEGETAALDRRVLLAFRSLGDPSDPLGPKWFEESVRDITALYRQVRTSAAVEPAGNPTSTADPSQEHDHE